MRSPVTLQDIARRARVCHTTVSRALNNRYNGEVSEKRAERIRRIAHELDYVPNHAALTLRRGRTHCIAVATHMSLQYAHANEMVEHLHAELTPLGYHLSLDLLYHVKDEESAWRFLDRSRCDGLIRLGALPNDGPRLVALRQKGLPVVIATGEFFPDLDCVDLDCAEAARRPVAHLVEQGHRRVALVYGVAEGRDSARVKGYQAALAAARLPFAEELLFQWTIDAAAAELWARIVGTIPRPTAIFTYNEEVAMGLLPVIRKAGLRVPHDVAIVTQGNTRLVRLAEAPLTAVDSNHAAIAKAAVERLMAQIEDPYTPPKQVRVEPLLVVRESSGGEGKIPNAVV